MFFRLPSPRFPVVFEWFRNTWSRRVLRAEAGFNLLEVMIAIAILAVSLMALFNFESTSLLASSRAQRTSTATQLARLKMAEVILDLENKIKKGEFPEEREESGTFDGEDFSDYRWKLVVKKVEIPPPPAKEGQADMMAQVFSMVSEQLSKLSREVRLTVSWMEFDEEVDGMTLVTHVVNTQGGF